MSERTDNWISGDEAKFLTEEIRQENANNRINWLREAKEKAKLSNKETFDLEKVLEYYYFPRNPQNKLEYGYYVSRSSVMTLKEFADRTREFDQYDGVG